MTRDPIPIHEPHPGAWADIAAPIPSALADADQALTEYGRWATARRGGGGKGETLDRWYRREADDKESLEAYLRRRAHVPQDPLMTLQDALIAQRALARVADQERVVLTILYIPQRLPPMAQLRMLRIPPQLSRIRHLAGLRMFDNLRRVVALRRQ